MFNSGSRQRYIANVKGVAEGSKSVASSAPDAGDIVRGMKSRVGVVTDQEGPKHVNVRTPLHEEGKVTASGFGSGSGGSFGGTGTTGGNFGSGGFGSSSAQVDRYNPVYDDLSRGTVAEDWVPLDPRLQNRMFRIMFDRGNVEGPVVETIADLCWSDFDITGIKDPVIVDTYEAAKEATEVASLLPYVTKEHLVTGRCTAQLILNAKLGIWSDLIIHDSDYLNIEQIPRSGFMPKIDLIPSPETINWIRSQDPRDLESKKGLSPEFLEQMGRNAPVPLDPQITAYMPRRSFFNDVNGTSFFVRNIPLWGLEKSLINATLVGHRRRAGPITQIAVGSEQWEPTADQIDALVAAYTAADEDSVSSTIGTRYDVQFNQIRGSLAEMWKWEDSIQFLREAKLSMFGVSEQLITGDFNIDTSIAPTVFMERLKAHRSYITETLLMQKFYRGLATVHNFRRRSKAELDHRIIINDEDHELQLPTIIFHKSLDNTADMQRADLLDKMEEVGLPVHKEEWCRTLGGGELRDRMRTSVDDAYERLEAIKLMAVHQKIHALEEDAADQENLGEQIEAIKEELSKIGAKDNDDGYFINKLTKGEKKNARKVADGVIDAKNLDPSQVHAPQNTAVHGSGAADLMVNHALLNKDKNTLSSHRKAV